MANLTINGDFKFEMEISNGTAVEIIRTVLSRCQQSNERSSAIKQVTPIHDIATEGVGQADPQDSEPP